MCRSECSPMTVQKGEKMTPPATAFNSPSLSDDDLKNLEDFDHSLRFIKARANGVALRKHVGTYISGRTGTSKTWTVTTTFDDLALRPAAQHRRQAGQTARRRHRKEAEQRTEERRQSGRPTSGRSRRQPHDQIARRGLPKRRPPTALTASAGRNEACGADGNNRVRRKNRHRPNRPPQAQSHRKQTGQAKTITPLLQNTSSLPFTEVGVGGPLAELIENAGETFAAVVAQGPAVAGGMV